MEAKIVKRNAGRYTLIDGNLFRHGFTHPILTCVNGDQCIRIMTELHERICGSHIGERALSMKVIRDGYYWSTMKEDCAKYAQRCKQVRSTLIDATCQPRNCDQFIAHGPFHTWGIDI